MKVYYAHPMVAYGTRREQEELDIIRRKAPDAEVINPARYSGDPGKTHEHMEFYHGLVDECDVLVYSDVGGEFMSAGVGEEVEYALEKGKPVYRIDHKTRRLVRVYGEAKHLSRTGTRLLYRTMKWSGFRVEDLNKMVQMKIAEFGGRLSEEDALLMVAADLGVNTKTQLNNTVKEAPEQIKAEKPSYRDAETLRRLYWEIGLSTPKMAELCGVDHKTILNWMREHGIPRRDRLEASVERAIEANTLYEKLPFSGNETEKWSIFGHNLGDVTASKYRRAVRVSTFTTHPAMIEWFYKVWGKYGHCHKYPIKLKNGKYGWKLYCYLDGSSFSFTLKKPNKIPEATELFNPLLANFSECEGSWGIYNNDGYAAFRFEVPNTNYELLEQVKRKMEAEGYHPSLYLDREAGAVDKRGVINRSDYYKLGFYRIDEVVSLAERLLPYTQHREKVEWMNLILEIRDELKAKGALHWADVEGRVTLLRAEIERDRDECVKEAEEEYKRRRG